METLTTLDKSIIRRLFSYLPLSDKLKLALVHSSCGDVLKDTLDREVLSPLDFSVNETIYLLSNYGAFIKRYEQIAMSEGTSFDKYLVLIQTYCSNLEEITFQGYEITPNNYHGQLLALSKQLKTLNLKRCTVQNAACSQLLAGLSQLQSLHLENSKVTGKHLGKLTNLIDLNLKRCRNFKCAHLIDVFKNNRLRRLNIVGVKQITPHTLQVLLETQSDLEKLILGTRYWSKNFQQICTLKNLREISMFHMLEESVAEYMEVLVAEKKDSLECLEVYLRVPYYDEDCTLTEELIINPICEFQNLKILSFRNCMLFDENHLVCVGKACRQLEMLDLSGSAITDVAIANCLEYLEFLRHLDISYCVVNKSLYFRLGELRREMGFGRPLVVYVKPIMDIASLLKSEEYLPGKNRLWLTLHEMRISYEDSLLGRLSHLNDIQNTINKPANSFMNKKSSERCPLFQLDDNCLFHIIQYLKPAENLNLLRTNERFVGVVKYYLNTNTIQFRHIFEKFTLREARELLSRYGSMIRRLYISYKQHHLNMEYFDLMAEYCTNLVELHCINVLDSEHLIRILNASANTLENLNVQNCEMSDSSSLVIAKAHNLHTLTLRRATISGMHLKKLTNLTTLRFQYCTDVRSEHFIEICKANRLLELDIKGCTNLNADAIRVVAETQKDLERITLGDIYAATNMHELADLNNIEHIKLINCQLQESIQFLRDVCEKRGNQIKTLAFEYYENFDVIFRLQLRKLIMNMKKLRLLRALYMGANDEDLMSIVDSCCQIEIIDVCFQRAPTLEGLSYPIKRLKDLQHYNVIGCRINDKYSFYMEALKIRKERLHKRSLTIYMMKDPNIETLKNTKQFAAMEKYVKVNDKDIPKSVIYDHPQQSKRRRQHGSESITTADDERLIFKILDLQDNCLTKIASYLEPVDRLKFASIHCRLLNSTRSLIDGMIFDLNAISKAFTVLEAKNLFRNCNNLIRKIRFNGGYFEYLQLIEPYSQYLVEIYIEDDNFLEYTLDNVIKIFASPSQKLQTLVFKKFPFADIILNVLFNKSELQVLKTTDWSSSENGSTIDMHAYTNLKELYLENCWYLEISHLRDICKNCRLKVLDLREAICMTPEVSKLLLETQNDCLEHLAISDVGQAQFSDDIARLSNLKHVIVQFGNFTWAHNIEKFVDKLIMYHSKDLLSLKVICTVMDNVDYSWFKMIEAKRCKFRDLSLIETVIAGPRIKRFFYY